MLQVSVRSWHHRIWNSPTHIQIAHFLVNGKPECVAFSQHIDIRTVLVYICNEFNYFKSLDYRCLCGFLPAMQETWVRSLGWEDPLKKEMATHSSTLARRTHGRRSLVGYSPRGCKELDTTEWLHFHFLSKAIGLASSSWQMGKGFNKFLMGLAWNWCPALCT